MTGSFHTANDRAAEVIEEFALFDDWTGRYEHLIEQARHLEPLPEGFRTPAYRIPGCQSQVWLVPETRDGRIRFLADSDAMITRGLIALLLRVLGDLPPDELLAAKLDWLDDIGMQEHLSSTRRNGLEAMVKRMRQAAEAALNTEDAE